jgi:hypothetical protein
VLGPAAGFRVEVVMPVAVPRALLADPPEQRAGEAAPGQLGELVDGGDDQRGGVAVDLLVDGQDR